MLRISLVLPLLAVACALPTKLGDLPESGDASGESGDGSGGPPTSGGTTPINSGGESDASGESGASDESGGGCEEVTVVRKPLRPSVVLVLDKSGSMITSPTGEWDHDADPNTPPVTRWSSLHGVVEAITDEFADRIDFGAHLYPGVAATSSYDAGSCAISPTLDVAPAPDNQAAILAALPAADSDAVRGGTPTAAALTTALDHLRGLAAGTPRAVLLVTDGAANCADGSVAPPLFEAYDESVHAIVADAFTADGIPTYVVGVGIADVTTPVAQDGQPDATNAFDRLNALADEGGKPRSDPDERFHNTVNQLELSAAIDEIAVDALSCVLPLDPAPQTPALTSVEIDGVAVAQVADCSAGDGWAFAAANGPFDAIVLCGSACTGLKLAGEASVTVCAE